jgi:hypothetical protein
MELSHEDVERLRMVATRIRPKLQHFCEQRAPPIVTIMTAILYEADPEVGARGACRSVPGMGEGGNARKKVIALAPIAARLIKESADEDPRDQGTTAVYQHRRRRQSAIVEHEKARVLRSSRLPRSRTSRLQWSVRLVRCLELSRHEPRSSKHARSIIPVAKATTREKSHRTRKPWCVLLTITARLSFGRRRDRGAGPVVVAAHAERRLRRLAWRIFGESVTSEW